MTHRIVPSSYSSRDQAVRCASLNTLGHNFILLFNQDGSLFYLDSETIELERLPFVWRTDAPVGKSKETVLSMDIFREIKGIPSEAFHFSRFI